MVSATETLLWRRMDQAGYAEQVLLWIGIVLMCGAIVFHYNVYCLMMGALFVMCGIVMAFASVVFGHLASRK